MPTIQQELKQSQPFGSKSSEAAVSLLRTADLIRRNIAAVVEPHGITIQQYNVLRILRGAGESGLPTLEIGQRMIEEMPGITRLLDRLESRNCVVRERCKTDRRQVFCRIAAGGLELLARLDEPLAQAEARALGLLAEQDLSQLVELLDRAREVLHSSIAHQRALNVQRTSIPAEHQRRIQ